MLDIMSPGITLNVRRSPTVKTATGVIASIIYVSVLIALLVILAIQYFTSDNPTISQLDFETTEYSMVNIVDRKLLPIFLLKNDAADEWMDPAEAMNLTTAFYRSVTFFRNASENYIETTSSNSLKTVHCSVIMK